MNIIKINREPHQTPIHIEKRNLGPGHIVPYHWHENFYEFEFIISGKGHYVINDVHMEATANKGFWATPLDFHSTDHNPEKPMFIYSLLFTEEYLTTEYQNILFNSKIRCVEFENP